MYCEIVFIKMKAPMLNGNLSGTENVQVHCKKT